MPITLVGFTTSESTGTTSAQTLPSGVQADDLLMMVNVNQNATALTAHPSFTQLHGVNGTAMAAQVQYRWATSSEPSEYTRSDNPNGKSVAILAAFRGVDRTNPFGAQATPTSNHTAGAEAIVLPGITAPSAGWIVSFVAACTANGVGPVDFTGTNMDSLDAEVTTNAGGAQVAAALMHEVMTGSGSFSPTVTSTPNPNRHGGFTYALREAAGGAPEHSGSVALSGSGTLTRPTQTPKPVASRSLSGNGTQTRSGKPGLTGIVLPTGSGTLTLSGEASGGTDFAGSVTLSGSGTLTIPTRTPKPAATQALSGSGGLTSTAQVTTSGSRGLSGSGTLSLSGEVPADTLIREYGFEEGSGTTAADSSGDNATLTGVPGWAAGVAGSNSAMSVNGTGPQRSLFNANGGPFTLMGWFNITNTGSGWDSLFEASGWLMYIEVAGLSLDWYHSNGGTLQVQTDLPENTWVHLAFVATGTQRRIVINGVTNVSTNSTVVANTGAVYIGGSPSQPGNMRVDEVRVFTEALSDSQITTWMNTHIGEAAPPEEHSGTVNLSGGGSLNLPSTHNQRGTRALSGVGTLTTVASAPNAKATRSLTGDGTQTRTGRAATAGTRGLSGEGTQLRSAVITASGTVTLSGTGVLGGTPDTQFAGTVGLNGSGTLAASATGVGHAGTRALTGSGTLTQTGAASFSRTLGLSGAGTLSRAAVAGLTGTLSRTGDGSLIHSVNVTASGTLARSGNGTLNAGGEGTEFHSGSLDLTGSGALSGSQQAMGASGLAQLGGSGALSGSARLTASGSRALSGAGSLTVGGSGVAPGAVALSGGSALSLAGSAGVQSLLNRSGEGQIDLDSLLMGARGTLTRAGDGSLTVSTGKNGSLVLGGAGSLGQTVVTVVLSGSTALSGLGGLVLEGSLVFTDTIDLSGAGLLAAAGSPGGVAVLGLSGNGTLSILTVATSVSEALGLSGSGDLALDMGQMPHLPDLEALIVAPIVRATIMEDTGEATIMVNIARAVVVQPEAAARVVKTMEAVL